MRNRYLAVLAILAAMLVTAGCPFRARIDTTPRTNQTITQATTNVKDGLTAVGNGLDQLARIDPLAINRLLTENTDLRKQVEEITKKLDLSTGAGMIEIESRDIQINVESYTGAFVIDGWVDDESNKFWSRRTFSRKDFSFGSENDNLRPILAESASRFGNNTFQAWDNVARASQSYFLKKVTDFMSRNTVLPGPDSETVDLNTSLGGVSGIHRIFLKVTPTAVDSSNSWGIVIKVHLKKGDGSLSLIRQFDRTLAQDPGHALNQPLPAIEILLRVKVGAR